jgi:hypothetical protein
MTNKKPDDPFADLENPDDDDNPVAGKAWSDNIERQAAEIKAKAAAALGSKQKKAAQDKAAPPWRTDMISARELCTMEFAPLQYIVPRVIPEGLTILAGRPKIGKSWLVLLIGILIAKHAKLPGLDYGMTIPIGGSVLYLSLEDGKRRLQRRMTKLIGSAMPQNWPASLYLKTEWRRFHQGGLEDIRAWHADATAKGQNPVLVIVDTLAKVRAPWNPNASPYQNDHDALAGLQKLADELRIAVIVNHHDRKMDAEDIFDTISGTLGLTGAVDTILVLSRKAQGTTLHIRSRDLEDETPLALQFDKATGQWSVLGDAADIQRSAERTRILTALAKAPEGLQVAEIMAAANVRSRNAADVLLLKMAEAGDIERIKRGLYGLPGTIDKIRAKVAEAVRGKKNGKKERSWPNNSEDQNDTNLSVNLSDEKDEKDWQQNELKNNTVDLTDGKNRKIADDLSDLTEAENSSKICKPLGEQGNIAQSFNLTDFSLPSRDDEVCAYCGQPGDLHDCAYDGIAVRLHRRCQYPWAEAYEAAATRNDAAANDPRGVTLGSSL